MGGIQTEFMLTETRGRVGCRCATQRAVLATPGVQLPVVHEGGDMRFTALDEQAGDPGPPP